MSRRVTVAVIATLAVSLALAITAGCIGEPKPPRSTQAQVLALLNAADHDPDARAALVTEGQSLFARMSCITCHAFGDTPMTGPRLDQLAAGPIKLATGESVEPDRPYLWRSIVTPGAQIVDGYQTGTRMTNFGQVLTDRDVAALIAFLQSRNGQTP